eukprot:9496263-Pyramimonas_sp.AAC.2
MTPFSPPFPYGQVTPNRENVAARALEELQGRQLETSGKKAELEVLVPVAWEEGLNPRTGRVTQMKTLLVPGYCMVKCVMDNDMHTLLRACYHVKGYAANATKITGPAARWDKCAPEFSRCDRVPCPTATLNTSRVPDLACDIRSLAPGIPEYHCLSAEAPGRLPPYYPPPTVTLDLTGWTCRYPCRTRSCGRSSPDHTTPPTVLPWLYRVDLPLPMPDAQLRTIFAAINEEQDLMEKRVEAKLVFPFEEGDVVTVTDGPYKGFSGQVRAAEKKVQV